MLSQTAEMADSLWNTADRGFQSIGGIRRARGQNQDIVGDAGTAGNPHETRLDRLDAVPDEFHSGEKLAVGEERFLGASGLHQQAGNSHWNLEEFLGVNESHPGLVLQGECDSMASQAAANDHDTAVRGHAASGSEVSGCRRAMPRSARTERVGEPTGGGVAYGGESEV